MWQRRLEMGDDHGQLAVQDWCWSFDLVLLIGSNRCDKVGVDVSRGDICGNIDMHQVALVEGTL